MSWRGEVGQAEESRNLGEDNWKDRTKLGCGKR